MQENHKNEIQRILEQSQADSEQTSTDLEIFKSEYKKLEEILTKTNDELSFYKNENLDSMMKKEITIINQSAEMDKISQKNKEMSEKYEISENLRKSQKESIEELKRKLQTIEDNLSDAVGISNSHLLIVEGKTKENDGLQNRILELTNFLSSAESENVEFVKETERLNHCITESLRTSGSMELNIEEGRLKVTELEGELDRVNDLNNGLSLSNEKQQELLALSDAKIEEVQEEMKDLVKSLVVLEASKEEEIAEFQSHIEKLVHEIQEKEGTYGSLREELSAVQSSLQEERTKSHDLQSRILCIESNPHSHATERVDGSGEGPGVGVGSGDSAVEGDEVSSLRSQLDAAQQIIDQYNAIDSQKHSLLHEIEGLRVCKGQLEENLSELETQLSTAVVTALSNEAAAKTEIETHLYESFRLASEVQGLQLVVEQQTEEIVFLQSRSASPRGSFTSNIHLSGDVMEGVRPEIAVFRSLISSDDKLINTDIGNRNDIKNIEIEQLSQQIQNQNEQIQGLSEEVQEASRQLEEKTKELLTASAALASGEAETASLVQQMDALRLEYLEKDDLISQVLDGKKTLEEEIKRFLGG